MAKLLTKIWKTFSGAFFETEEEALKAERLDAMSGILFNARKKALAADYEAYERAKEIIREHNDATRSYGARREPYPRDPAHSYPFCPGMEQALLGELEAAGLLSPLKLTEGQDNEA